MSGWRRGWTWQRVVTYGAQSEQAVFWGPMYDTREEAEAGALHPFLNTVGLRVMVVEVSEWTPANLALGAMGSAPPLAGFGA